MLFLCCSSRPGEASPESCDFGDVEACPRLCAKGDAQSCYLHARALDDGNRVPRDRPRAATMFAELCSKGHGDACNAQAHTILDEIGDENTSDAKFKHAMSLYEKGCSLGSSKACTNMGSFHRRASLGRSAEYLGFFVRACTLGAPGAATGCNEAGTDLREGRFGTKIDRQRAAELFKRGCELGANEQCANATALGVKAFLSPIVRVQVLDRACRGGDTMACANLIEPLVQSRGAAANPARAAHVAEVVCYGDWKAAYGCYWLALVRLSGKLDGGVDVAGAVEPLRRSCWDPRGNASACVELASLTVMGQGVAADRDEAQRLYDRACQLNPPRGCHEAGALKAASGDERIEALAERLFVEGCRNGDEHSCAAMSRAGVANDLRREGRLGALATFRRGCTDGDADSCLKVGDHLNQKENKGSEAVPYFERACNGGSAFACVRLSGVLTEGRDVPKDPDRAAELAARACSLGGACHFSRRLLKSAMNAGASPEAVAKAMKVLADACAVGVKGACAAAAD